MVKAHYCRLHDSLIIKELLSNSVIDGKYIRNKEFKSVVIIEELQIFQCNNEELKYPSLTTLNTKNVNLD